MMRQFGRVCCVVVQRGPQIVVEYVVDLSSVVVDDWVGMNPQEKKRFELFWMRRRFFSSSLTTPGKHCQQKQAPENYAKRF